MWPACYWTQRYWPRAFWARSRALDIREVLYAYLMSIPALTSILTVIRPGMFSQGDVMPALTYTVVSNIHGYTVLSGDRTKTARIQFDVWSRELAISTTVKTVLENILIGPEVVIPNLDYLFITQQDEQDLFEKPIDGSDQYLYHIACDYLIRYQV